ncbi:MAG: antitoxin family protein [Hormoscilla sp. SP12CHS1]|nr:antitoxin family protein [Hormoscilla sp. SP12CHS1]
MPDTTMLETQTIEAIYEGGVLRPLQTLSGLSEGGKVKITIVQPARSTADDNGTAGAGDRPHPLLKFAGTIDDAEAAELQRIIADEFGKIDYNEW